MTPTKPSRRRVVLIGIIGLVVLGFIHLGFVIADSDSTWLSWTEPLGFWAVAFLAYKFELDRHHDVA
jgi:putative exporter of polyketide antibiotics